MAIVEERIFTDGEIVRFSDEKLVDELVCAGRSEVGSSLYLNKLKAEMKRRLQRPRGRWAGWGS